MISSLPKWVGNLFEGTLAPNVKVLSTSYISPQIKKIGFQGNINKMNFQIGYANVIRVSETEYRNYTVANYNKDTGTFEIIFHIHGNGVGSKYIDDIRIGDEMFISSPRGRNAYNPKVNQYFLIGDETSLGLACSFLPRLKQNQHHFQFFLELDEENQNVPQLLALENFKVFSKGLFRSEKWVQDLAIFDHWQTANFILAGNVKSVQTLRKILKNRTSGTIYSHGYWLEGKKGL